MANSQVLLTSNPNLHDEEIGDNEIAEFKKSLKKRPNLDSDSAGRQKGNQ